MKRAGGRRARPRRGPRAGRGTPEPEPTLRPPARDPRLIVPVPPIAAEALVPAISGEAHRDLLPGPLAEHERGDGGGIRERLVEVPGHAIEQLDRGLAPLDLMPPGTVSLGGH